MSIGIAGSQIEVPSGGAVAFGSITPGTNTGALVIGTGGSLSVSGTGTIAATGVSQTATSGTNIVGTNSIIASGAGTGSAASASVQIQAPQKGGSGSTAESLITVASFSDDLINIGTAAYDANNVRPQVVLNYQQAGGGAGYKNGILLHDWGNGYQTVLAQLGNGNLYIVDASGHAGSMTLGVRTSPADSSTFTAGSGFWVLAGSGGPYTSMGIPTNSGYFWTYDTVVWRPSSTVVAIGSGHGGSMSLADDVGTLDVAAIGRIATSGTNTPGNNLTVAAGAGTGSATPSVINLQVPVATGSGSTLQVLGTIATVSSTGLAVTGIVNATTGFQVNGGATSGHVLRGNGTNFVDAALALTDLSGVLAGVTGSIGGSPLILGQAATGTVSITGASAAVAAGAVIIVTPVTQGDPGAGFIWTGYLSGSDTITVSVICIVAGTPTATTYNVAVLTA